MRIENSMKIGVLSDTHLRSPNPVLEYILEELFADTEMVLHAGDIVGPKVLDRLEMNEVIAVCGNMDDYEIAQAIPQVRVIAAAGKQVGPDPRMGIERRAGAEDIGAISDGPTGSNSLWALSRSFLGKGGRCPHV